MFKWLHHLLNPHCEHCREIEQDSRVCNSCEILKSQVARLTFENDRLLNELLHPVKVEEKKVDTSNLQPILPRSALNWRVRRQMLEAEDREKAKLINRNENEVLPKVATISTEDLEKELGIVESERESQSK